MPQQPGAAVALDGSTAVRFHSFSLGKEKATPRRVRPKEDSGDRCAYCDEAFSLRRGARRHCRKCGGAYHADCLPHKAHLPDMLYTEAMPVCDECFLALGEAIVVTAQVPVHSRGWLQLRQDPTLNSRVEDSVAPGARLVVEEDRGEWLRVRRRAATGWVERKSVLPEGCDENCNSTHHWDGECRICGQVWSEHGKGHGCPGAGRGSWAEVDRVVDKPCKIVVGSWNVAEINPPQDEGSLKLIRQWLQIDERPDFVAVGLQEIDMTAAAAWSGESERAEPWINALQKATGLKLLYAQQLGGVMLIVFRQTKRQHGGVGWAPLDLREGIVRRGAAGGLLANKGAVGVRLRLHRTTVAFVNAHLAAHQDKVEVRNADFQGILDTMAFEDEDTGETKGLLETDRVFFFGDLNYRVDMPYEVAVRLASSGEIAPLLDCDQLRRQMQLPLSPYSRMKWQEAVPCFAPTYKYDPGTDNYDSSAKKRIPAWCDRVLWWARPYANRLWGLSVAGRKVRRGAAIRVDGGGEGSMGDPISLIGFTRGELKQSDHRPVCAFLNVNMSVPVDEVSAAAREVGEKSALRSQRDMRPGLMFYNPLQKWGQLSTFYMCWFTDDKAVRWPSVEHYYQAHKFEGTAEFDVIHALPTAELAHEQGRRLHRANEAQLRKDWETVKEDIMNRASLMKFEQDLTSRTVLLSTGDRALKYRDRDDRFWGTGSDGMGSNKLGHILESVRAQVRASEGQPISFQTDGTGPAPELGNDFPCRFVVGGRRWESVTHCFEASRFPREGETYMKIRDAPTAEEAKELARAKAGEAVPGWEDERLGIMVDALTAKFSMHDAARAALLNTQGRNLRCVDKDDGYWGTRDDGAGLNYLGKLMEEVRENLSWMHPRSQEEGLPDVSRITLAQTTTEFDPMQRNESMFMGERNSSGPPRQAAPPSPRDKMQRAGFRPGLFECCASGAASFASMLCCAPCHLGGLLASLSGVTFGPKSICAAAFCFPCATCLVRERLVEKSGKDESLPVSLGLGMCFPLTYFQAIQVSWRERTIVTKPWQLQGCCSAGAKRKPPSPTATQLTSQPSRGQSFMTQASTHYRPGSVRFPSQRPDTSPSTPQVGPVGVLTVPLGAQQPMSVDKKPTPDTGPSAASMASRRRRGSVWIAPVESESGSESESEAAAQDSSKPPSALPRPGSASTGRGRPPMAPSTVPQGAAPPVLKNPRADSLQDPAQPKRRASIWVPPTPPNGSSCSGSEPGLGDRGKQQGSGIEFGGFQFGLNSQWSGSGRSQSGWSSPRKESVGSLRVGRGRPSVGGAEVVPNVQPPPPPPPPGEGSMSYSALPPTVTMPVGSMGTMQLDGVPPPPERHDSSLSQSYASAATGVAQPTGAGVAQPPTVAPPGVTQPAGGQPAAVGQPAVVAQPPTVTPPAVVAQPPTVTPPAIVAQRPVVAQHPGVQHPGVQHSSVAPQPRPAAGAVPGAQPDPPVQQPGAAMGVARPADVGQAAGRAQLAGGRGLPIEPVGPVEQLRYVPYAPPSLAYESSVASARGSSAGDAHSDAPQPALIRRPSDMSVGRGGGGMRVLPLGNPPTNGVVTRTGSGTFQGGRIRPNAGYPAPPIPTPALHPTAAPPPSYASQSMPASPSSTEASYMRMRAANDPAAMKETSGRV
eukprot:Hpha_TRINITY_DN14766_c1_g3::TRINITY_DN14766_c1_g3_i1::g.102393::m.102393